MKLAAGDADDKLHMVPPETSEKFHFKLVSDNVATKCSTAQAENICFIITLQDELIERKKWNISWRASPLFNC